MQNRYVGDIGDFVKYGLLRALTPGLKLGVAWYMFPDEEESTDGRHLEYLDDPERWRHLDPVLFDELKRIVEEGQRSVAAVEASIILEGASFYSKVQSTDLGTLDARKAWREGWFSDLFGELGHCDLVFADPDNGLYLPDDKSLGRKKFWKSLPLDEARLLAKGRTLVFYHHNTRRKGGHDLEVDYWAKKLGPRTIALRWRAYSARTFFVVNPTKVIAERLEEFVKLWRPEARLHVPSHPSGRSTSSASLKRDRSIRPPRQTSTPSQSGAFIRISDFVGNKMRMSHIYQPAMLIELLLKRGAASVTEVAKALLARDISQIEYYENVSKNMVGRVLARHGITDREGNRFSLLGFEELSPKEIRLLVALCTNKIDEFLEARGDRPWAHRRRSAGYISGTLRYEVLKRAKFRCELCGISAEDKALEADHILPRNAGGTDDLSNLQSLCYSCNAMKRDRDDTDFRGVADSYKVRERGCSFCNIPEGRIVSENELCFAIRDLYPVTDLHTLIIPKRHVSDFFDLYQPERNASQMLLELERSEIMKADPTVTGFNVGTNSGEDAGQTVFHCHIHLIPRRKGDIENPRGGVRGVIPSKQRY